MRTGSLPSQISIALHLVCGRITIVNTCEYNEKAKVWSCVAPDEVRLMRIGGAGSGSAGISYFVKKTTLL